MSKNRLLDFYEKALRIDLPVPESTIYTFNEYSRKLDTDKDYRQKILYYIYQNSSVAISSYKSCSPQSDYFKNVSGVRLIETQGYIGVIDFWFPTEPYFFDIVRNPILAGFYVSEVFRNSEGMIKVITDLTLLMEVDRRRILYNALRSFSEAIIGLDVFGFWMIDLRNNKRTMPIKVREFKVKEMEIHKSISSLGYILSVTLVDQKTKEEKMLGFGNYFSGWNFYLSRPLLNQKLSEIEVLWMRNYDNRVGFLDSKINEKKKELKRLIKERKNFMNGITEYQEKIKGILYGKTVGLH